MTIDIREAYRRALDDFGALVHQIGPGQWQTRTPCVDWDVRTLVNHVIKENLEAPELLSGRAAAEIGDLFDGDLLGDDPIKAFDASAMGAVQAASGERSLTSVTHLSFGDVPGAEYIAELFADVLIHTWDLARAIGADERLDPELVEACETWFSDAANDYRQAEITEKPQPVPSGTDPQTRLLASWGRRG